MARDKYLKTVSHVISERVSTTIQTIKQTKLRTDSELITINTLCSENMVNCIKMIDDLNIWLLCTDICIYGVATCQYMNILEYPKLQILLFSTKK
jgi:hypothetical protein